MLQSWPGGKPLVGGSGLATEQAEEKEAGLAKQSPVCGQKPMAIPEVLRGRQGKRGPAIPCKSGTTS